MNFIAIKLSSAFTRFKYLQIYIIFIKMFCHMGRDPFCHPHPPRRKYPMYKRQTMYNFRIKSGMCRLVYWFTYSSTLSIRVLLAMSIKVLLKSVTLQPSVDVNNLKFCGSLMYLPIPHHIGNANPIIPPTNAPYSKKYSVLKFTVPK